MTTKTQVPADCGDGQCSDCVNSRLIDRLTAERGELLAALHRITKCATADTALGIARAAIRKAEGR